MLKGKNIWFLLAVVIILVVGFVYFLTSNNKVKVDNNVVTTKLNTNTKNMNDNVVLLKTNMGDIKIKLFTDKSPITAGNFKKLAEEGFYDGVRFHRVIKGFMIQSGDPLSKDDKDKALWGTGGPGYVIKDEFIKGLSNIRGTIAMANSGPNTGGSQFFINLKDNTFLDWDKPPTTSKHPVFGEVISGMDVVDKIANVETDGSPQIGGHDRPIKDITIEKATVE